MSIHKILIQKIDVIQKMMYAFSLPFVGWILFSVFNLMQCQIQSLIEGDVTSLLTFSLHFLFFIPSFIPALSTKANPFD